MKTAISKKAEGSSPAKKVVKRVVSQDGTPVLNRRITSPAVQAPIAKKDDSPSFQVNQVKPVGQKREETDISIESNAMNVQVGSNKVDNANTKSEEKVAIYTHSTEPRDVEEKPKAKKGIVKKKVTVDMKSSVSTMPSTSEPESTFNPVTAGKEDNKKAGSMQGQTYSGSTGSEAKPNLITSEKPKKVIKKVIVRKKGSAAVPKEGKMQNLVASMGKKDDQLPVVQKVDGAVNNDTSKSLIQEVSPHIESPNKVEAIGVMEGEDVVPAVEELQSDDNHDVGDQPVAEEQNNGAGLAPTRPLSERQKRKKLEVFVGGLDKDATDNDLRAAFQPVGDVVEVRLMMNPVTGKNKGYAFVRFASPEQAVLAATEFSAMQIRGKECGVLPNQDNDTLFIGNISRDWKSNEVAQKLKEYGVNGIEELTLIGDPQNEALNRGYAFLELATHYDALNAFQRLQRPGVTFGYDRPAKVAWAQPLAAADASAMSQVKSVFVDGLPPNWTEDMVKQNFGKFGEIERVVFARNMPFAKRKDFAFVYFSSHENALACIQACNNTELTDGDKKVKVKVSLTRPLNKGKVEKAFRYSGYSGHGRGRGGRGEGWFSTRFGGRSGRGFGRSDSSGTFTRMGKRLYDEDEVRMLLKAAREQQDWPSTTGRGRGNQFGRAPRDMTRGVYAQNDEIQYYDDVGQGESFRPQEKGTYMHDTYSRPSANLESSRGNAPKPVPIRDTYEPHHPSASRVRASYHVSPHRDAQDYQRYDHSPMYWENEGAIAGGIQDYPEMAIGRKRTAAAWDEDAYEFSHRGYPSARVDYTDSPEVAQPYAGHPRSPAGPVTQTGSMRQSRSTREGGLSKSGPTYSDHIYNSVPPETSTYPLEGSERRETSMYPSAVYGGHGASMSYDFHPSGYH